MASSDSRTTPCGFEDAFDAGAAALAEEIVRGVGSSPLRGLLRDPAPAHAMAAEGAVSAALAALLREAAQRLVERRRGLAARRAATA